jgi:hypothetical protein
MRGFPAAIRERETRRYGERERKREEQRAAERERAVRDWELLKARVRADREAAAKAAAAEAAEVTAMTPAQLAAREHQRQTPTPTPPPPRPDFYFLAAEEVEREDREAEREQRERDTDLPRRQAEWDARFRAINEARDAAIRKAAERCRADEQAARDRAESEMAELGGRPTLETIEVAA